MFEKLTKSRSDSKGRGIVFGGTQEISDISIHCYCCNIKCGMINFNLDYTVDNEMLNYHKSTRNIFIYSMRMLWNGDILKTIYRS